MTNEWVAVAPYFVPKFTQVQGPITPGQRVLAANMNRVCVTFTCPATGVSIWPGTQLADSSGFQFLSTLNWYMFNVNQWGIIPCLDWYSPSGMMANLNILEVIYYPQGN